MRLSNFNIDFISGHVPYYQQKNVAVKTNQFYRDAFVNQMKSGQGLPVEIKRQMGLNQVFDDEKNYQSSIGHKKKDSKIETRHCSGVSNQKVPQEHRITLSVVQKRRIKASSSQATFRSNKKDNQNEGSENQTHLKNAQSQQILKQQQDFEDPEQIRQFLRAEQQKIYFVKPLEQKQNIRYAPLRKFHELSNKQSQMQSQMQSEKASRIIGSEDQDEQYYQIKSELNLEDQFKEKFQNSNINKILSGRLDQENETKNEFKNNFNRVSHTSQQSKRQTKSSVERVSSDRKFLDAEVELKESNSNPITKRNYFVEVKDDNQEYQGQKKTRNQISNSQDGSNNSMINKLIRERQNNQQESYMNELNGTYNQQHFNNIENNGYNQFQQHNQEGMNQMHQGQNVPKYTENYQIGNINTFTPQMYRQISKVNEPILSNPVVITKYQINQQFQNHQTIQNQLREQVNSEQRKELLSFFNENRYKYFSNNDLNAEKFFVTRNRERIKDLNFERIGIFKSKQPQTHVKHFRFFINDLKVQEPRFQNPLKTEQEQLSLEQSFRKASHASHNSKLSSSDIVKEAIPSQKETGNIAANLIGESGSKGVLNSPIGLGNGNNIFSAQQAYQNQQSITSLTDKQISSTQLKTPILSPQALTAAGTSPQQNSGQSNFQFMSNNTNYGGVDQNNDDSLDNNDTQNIKKLKQQYLSFVQQNMNPKLQQVKLNSNLIQEEKDESILEEDQNHKEYVDPLINKKKKPSMNNLQVYSQANQKVPSITSIKNKRQLKQNASEKELINSNQGMSSQTIMITENDHLDNLQIGEYEENTDAFLLFSAKNDAVSPISSLQNPIAQNKQKKFQLNLQQQNDEQNINNVQKSKKFAQMLVGQDSAEFDNKYMVCMQIDKETDGDYIYSKQFQEQIKSLEEEQKRLEDIENLFFLKLKQKEINFYNSEDFKIHRKKVLLDTILKNKKITRRDKKLIFSNLLYQYSIKSGLHSKDWCNQMTHFLMTNKFKYNLDEAANRKYERAQQKIIQLPTFRDPNGEYYHDLYQYVHQLASPTPLSTEENEIHFHNPDSISEDLEKQQLHIKRFKPKQLSKTYSHFQFQKFKY